MKKQSKKNSQFVTRKQFITYNVVLAVFVLTGFIGVAWTTMRHIEVAIDDPSQVREVLINANDSLTVTAPNVPQHNVQYIPEMRLTLTSSADSRIAYRYDEGSEEIPEQAVITSTYIKRESANHLYSYNGVRSFFDQIPQYQNCGSIYILTFENRNPGYTNDAYEYVEDVKVSENNTAHIWRNEAGLCRAATDHGTQGILDALKTAKRY